MMSRIQNSILSFQRSGVYAYWPDQAWQEDEEEQTKHPEGQFSHVLTPFEAVRA